MIQKKNHKKRKNVINYKLLKKKLLFFLHKIVKNKDRHKVVVNFHFKVEIDYKVLKNKKKLIRIKNEIKKRKKIKKEINIQFKKINQNLWLI